MIIEKVIQDRLFGLVGFRDSIIPEYSIVDSSNQQSDSGLFFQDVANNLVSIKGIKEVQEYADISDADFNTYLGNLQKDVTLSFVKGVITEQSRFLETKALFPFAQDFSSTETPSNGFVGIKIQPNLNQCSVLEINTLAVSFDNTDPFYVYLFSSELQDRDNYLYRVQVTPSPNQTVKYNLGWKVSLSNSSDRGTAFDNLGGEYYLGYYEDDLGNNNPYKRSFELSSSFRGSAYNYMDFSRFSLNGERIDPNNDTALTDPFGLNINYSSYNDFTDLVINNKNLFARGIQLKMAEKVLENILGSTRTNYDQRQLKEVRNIANYTLNDERVGVRVLLDQERNNVRKLLFPEDIIQTYTLR